MDRFFKPGLIGGLIGGVLGGIPILGGLLVLCFCMPSLIGSAISVNLYLKDHPTERLTGGDAAICGGIAGAVTGLVASLLGMLFSLLAGSLIAGLSSSMPSFMPSMAMNGIVSIIMIPVYALIYGGMGALGGFLSMQLFFKDRAAS
jgi:hypothetical protein